MNKPPMPEITDAEREAAEFAAIWRNEVQFLHDNRHNYLPRDDFKMLPPWCEEPQPPKNE